MTKRTQSKRFSGERFSVLLLVLFLGAVSFWFFDSFLNPADEIVIDGDDASVSDSEKPQPPQSNHPSRNKRKAPSRSKEAKATEQETLAHPIIGKRGLVFVNDETGVRFGVASAIITIEQPKDQLRWNWGRSGKQAQTGSEGHFSILSTCTPPFDVQVWAKGYISRVVRVTAADYASDKPIEIEVQSSQRAWISVRMIPDNGGAMVDGARIEMRTGGSSCGSLRNRLRVESFHSVNDLPQLHGTKRKAPTANGHFSFTREGPAGLPRKETAHGGQSIIGSLDISRREKWVALLWEDEPIQIVEIPADDEIAEFVIHEYDIANIESTCSR
jgi:hypothetical protein